LPLHFNEGESGDEDGVVAGGEGLVFETALEDVDGFSFVVGEPALEEPCIGRDNTVRVSPAASAAAF